MLNGSTTKQFQNSCSRNNCWTFHLQRRSRRTQRLTRCCGHVGYWTSLKTLHCRSSVETFTGWLISVQNRAIRWKNYSMFVEWCIFRSFLKKKKEYFLSNNFFFNCKSVLKKSMSSTEFQFTSCPAPKLPCVIVFDLPTKKVQSLSISVVDANFFNFGFLSYMRVIRTARQPLATSNYRI